MILDHLIAGGFLGELVVIHPDAAAVGPVATVSRAADLDQPPDLAVIALERSAAARALAELADRGARAAIVVSAGFAEVGGEGLETQQQLVTTARAAGMRLLGPNCMGVINTAPEVRLHASFGVGPAPAGSLALVTQSGSVGDYLLYHARRSGLGVSILASAGNEADVTIDELITAAAADEQTRAIACYLELPARPPAVLRAVARASREKPVILLRGGRTLTGAGAAASHTGRLLDQPGGAAVDALFEQSGAILVQTLEEMLASAAALTSSPRGCRAPVALLTNAGGPAVLAIDELSARGVAVLEASALVAESSAELPRIAAGTGPVVDLTASARAEHFESAARALAPAAGALLGLVMSPEGTDPEPIVEALGRDLDPVVVLGLLAQGPAVERARERAHQLGLPVAADPNLAAAAVHALIRRGLGVGAPAAEPAPLAEGIEERLEAVLASGREVLTLLEGLELCRALGLQLTPWEVAEDADGAVDAAARLGPEVVVKLDLPGTLHKTEEGLVSGPCRGLAEAREAAVRLLSYRGKRSGQLVIQRRAAGVELLLGASSRSPWGPIGVVGLGGVAAEAMADLRHLRAPTTAAAAEAALRSLRAAAVLDEFRGAPPVELTAAVEAAVTFSALASQAPMVYEIEANPFMAGRGTAETEGIVDVKVVLRRERKNQEGEAHR